MDNATKLKLWLGPEESFKGRDYNGRDEDNRDLWRQLRAWWILHQKALPDTIGKANWIERLPRRRRHDLNTLWLQQWQAVPDAEGLLLAAWAGVWDELLSAEEQAWIVEFIKEGWMVQAALGPRLVELLGSVGATYYDPTERSMVLTGNFAFWVWRYARPRPRRWGSSVWEKLRGRRR